MCSVALCNLNNSPMIWFHSVSRCLTDKLSNSSYYSQFNCPCEHSHSIADVSRTVHESCTSSNITHFRTMYTKSAHYTALCIENCEHQVPLRTISAQCIQGHFVRLDDFACAMLVMVLYCIILSSVMVLQCIVLISVMVLYYVWVYL